jgi:hypothetical protein
VAIACASGSTVIDDGVTYNVGSAGSGGGGQGSPGVDGEEAELYQCL